MKALLLPIQVPCEQQIQIIFTSEVSSTYICNSSQQSYFKI